MNPINLLKKALIALVLSIVLLLPASTSAQPSVTELAKKSVVALSNQDGRTYCSGFIIHPDIVQTAFHCLTMHDGTLIVDGKRASLVHADPYLDSATLSVKTGLKPALRLADKTPSKGSKVYSLGYALGLKQLHMTAGTIQSYTERMILASPMALPGMSGGPVINEQGEVVGVNYKISGSDGYHSADVIMNMQELKKHIPVRSIKHED